MYCRALHPWSWKVGILMRRSLRMFVCLRLGNRSPVLVAMAFREAGMNPQESIDFVRSRRRGSFNVRQLEFLQNYQSKRRLSDKHVGCLLM